MNKPWSRLIPASLLVAATLPLFAPALPGAEKKKIVLVAGRGSHGAEAHNHPEGCKLLAEALNASGLPVEATVHTGGWPKDPDAAFEDASTVVIYCDGGGGHIVNKHVDSFRQVMDRGVGLVCIHYGVEVPKGKSGDAFLDWIGGYFETHWSVNPHWTAEFKTLPKHPVTNGVKPFSLNDEWYYHMRFREGMKGVTPILSAHPPANTLKRRDGAHSGNPHVRAAVGRGEIQHVAWAAERPNGGRGFGITGAHYHKCWAHDDFRTLVLNAIVWTAKAEVPSTGVPSKTPDLKKKSAAAERQRPPAGRARADAAVFASKVIDRRTPGQAVEIDAEIKGAKELHLVVDDGGDGFSHDWAAWAEPRLVDAAGKETRLTALTWKSASTDFSEVRVGRNSGGRPLRIKGEPVAYGIGTHANSLISYALPAGHGFVRFKARGGLDNGGIDQPNARTSLRFLVYTQKPKFSLGRPGASAANADRDPASAVDNLEVGEGLEATLFASEPAMLSPSAIDIDHRGRVWVCEVVNYRGHRNKRPEGDRLLILEDTDGDNRADKVKVFHQGRDIDSAHGVCVLGNHVIVSAGDKVMVFTDSDGDDKPDKKDILFTGISGTQHDHGIHAFLFGPDGKLYFNFGNSGRQIKDKDGKIIVDAAGNEVVARRQPYQEGMVFRCDLDGSNLETLGWNFRNNWEVTVDSFGTLWQSDNDDDGNQGVRINYVMEFGNYGYKDEFTGAGWKSKRTNYEKLRERAHWHLNDPGVVPNLLHTGAGSPTGITVYEGDLLPATFRGQVIHCDAGPSIVRAYPVKKDGAGYTAEVVNILDGARMDRWFRPSDAVVAPDGSLIVADWYDPGVGGHGMGDLERGRLFLVAPPGHRYTVPEYDLTTAEGAAEALKNPNFSVRYLAWRALNKMGQRAESALFKLWNGENPRHSARALWLLGRIENRGEHYVRLAAKDADPDLRITGIRLARQLGLDLIPLVNDLVRDPSPQVRRELAIALRHHKSPRAAGLWAELAEQHDGADRWYLEALGIGADKQWDEYFGAWLKRVGSRWDTPAGRDIIWRSRAAKAPALIAEILTDPKTPEESHPRYLRALDFHKGKEKDRALEKILGL